MTEPMHSHFGGSVAPRVLRCPGSVALIEQVPAELRKGSTIYADAGTAKHSAMTLVLDDVNPIEPEALVGRKFGDYIITEDDIVAIRLAYDYAAKLIDTPGAEYYLEKRVEFPGIDGAFGTLDVIVRIGNKIWVVDFKFGSGVPVLALYSEGDSDIVNAQLAYYAVAARHSLAEFFRGVDNIELVIVQPITADIDAKPVSSVVVTHAELDEFIAVYRAACEEALSPSPRLAKGTHCRFCPARPICPQHTKPFRDLAQFKLPQQGATAAFFGIAPPKAEYLKVLAEGLDLLDAIKDLRVALHDQAKRALEAGDDVPGYALSAGRAERHWQGDDPTTIAALMNLGLSRNDVVAEEIRSPKQVEMRAKARGLKIPAEFISSRRSGVSLVRSENARRPVPGREEIAQSLAAALKALKGGARL